jgi:hypothetical protein
VKAGGVFVFGRVLDVAHKGVQDVVEQKSEARGLKIIYSRTAHL